MTFHRPHATWVALAVAALSVTVIISMVRAEKPAVMIPAVSHNLQPAQDHYQSPEAYWNSLLPNTTIPRAVLIVLHPGKGEETVLPDLVRRRYVVRRNSYNRRRYTRINYKSHYTRNNNIEDEEVVVNPSSAPWFLFKDLYPGKEMELEIARPEADSYSFISRQKAELIPFSSNNFTAIFKQLAINSKSPKAELMKDVIKECELPAEEGEVKTCATSLESMIDFSILRLGKHVQAVSTEAEKDTKLQKFTILKGIKQIGDDEAVACHKQDYAYAVFYCHDVKGSRAFIVPFVGSDGTKVKAVGICHTNTTGWSPEHVSFRILKVKPGGEAICHFLPEYNVLWTRK